MNRAELENVRILKITLIGFLIGLSLGTIRGLTVMDSYPLWAYMLKGSLTATSISLVTSLFEFKVFQRMLRKNRFSTVLLVKMTLHTATIVLLFSGISLLFMRVLPLSNQNGMFFPILFLTWGSIMVGTFLVNVNRLLGKRVLSNFLLGRYHRPVEEERIFMFLDLTASTAIAEKIGHLKFHQLLSEFFFDITDHIVAHGGEIYKYVGDEVIIVWPVRGPLENRNCLRCFFAISKEIERQAEKYRSLFGVLPRFKAGMHCGTVVVGEMGDYRMEIAFLGDVVNTAARIQAETKAYASDLLISKDLFDSLEMPPELLARSLGRVKLRGKEAELELFRIEARARTSLRPDFAEGE